jgi:hypothetical protein
MFPRSFSTVTPPAALARSDAYRASLSLTVLPEDEAAVPELHKAVDQRSQSTKALLVKFVELAGQGVRASADELRERCGVEGRKSATAEASVRLLAGQLAAARAEQDRTAADLLRAEKQLDRLRCQSIVGQLPAEARPGAASITPAPGPSHADGGDRKPSISGATSPGLVNGAATNGAGTAGSGAGSTLDPNAPQPSLASLVEATLPDPADRALAESRLAEISTLRAERVRLEQSVDRLRLEVDHPPEAVVTGSALFKCLLAQLDHFQRQAKQAREEYDTLVIEADSLRDGRRAFETLAAVSPLATYASETLSKLT